MLGSLFLSFLRIGAFTFGGGYAMIALIEREVITKRGWIEREEFLDLLALAQSAPGPIALNTAVFVGYKLRGYSGALTALLGAVLPSFLIILVVAIFFREIRQNPVIEAAFRGMRPAVVALILYPVISLSRGMKPICYLIIAASALSIWALEWSPILLILMGGIGGILWQIYQTKRGGER